MNNQQDMQKICETVDLYFKGTHEGNVEKLQRAFHPDARITGSINATIYDWSLSAFIERVTKAPANSDAKYDKKIILIDQVGDAAIVKARVVVNDLIFTDYITLLKINGEWVIRNKSFTT